MTPHNEAKLGEIADTILLPGDPLRAKHIAANFLADAKQVNGVRNMLGFTGFYKGKRVSVMGTGMGMPSMAIYAHELISVYGAKNLIRVGSAGALLETVKLRDIVFAQAASTDSNFGKQFGLNGEIAALPDFKLLQKAVAGAEKMGARFHVGHVLSSDIFYPFDPDIWKKWAKMGVLCAEMETYALFMTASLLGASALSVLTVSDSLVSGEGLSSEERQISFSQMIEIALGLA